MKIFKKTKVREISIDGVVINPNVSYVTTGAEWYPPVQLSPEMIKRLATDTATLQESMLVLSKLEPDEYSKYLLNYYESGLSKFGELWHYADIVTTLLSTAKLLKPKNYLEIGVRRGRSMAIVAATNPECTLFGFDMWADNYAGMSNPGPDFVRNEMMKVGYSGKLEFVNGDSHITLPKFFKQNPDIYFDLITVDGDHSEKGAADDIDQVIPNLAVGGVIIFDDINHPAHPYLMDVWRNCVKSDNRFTTWEYTDLGYGVAAGIKMSE